MHNSQDMALQEDTVATATTAEFKEAFSAKKLNVLANPNTNVPVPDGLDYYVEKMDLYVLDRLKGIGDPVVRDFEKIWKDFEKDYFASLPRMMRVTTEMLAPWHQRMAFAFMRYTS